MAKYGRGERGRECGVSEDGKKVMERTSLSANGSHASLYDRRTHTHLGM